MELFRKNFQKISGVKRDSRRMKINFYWKTCFRQFLIDDASNYKFTPPFSHPGYISRRSLEREKQSKDKFSRRDAMRCNYPYANSFVDRCDRKGHCNSRINCESKGILSINFRDRVISAFRETLA